MASNLAHLVQQLVKAEWVITGHSLHTEGPEIVTETPMRWKQCLCEPFILKALHCYWLLSLCSSAKFD